MHFSWAVLRFMFSDRLKSLEYLLSQGFALGTCMVVLSLCQSNVVVRWQDHEQMSDLRLREVKELIQGHTTRLYCLIS